MLRSESVTDIHLDMNYCRRCGAELKVVVESQVYCCSAGHQLFMNPVPAAALILRNDRDEVLIIERGSDPGKGYLSIPGGFCDFTESVEEAVRREMQEEVGIFPEHYGQLEFVSSSIDAYDYGGEILSALTVIFTARTIGELSLAPADDAASAAFMKLEDIDMDKVYFPTIRQALESLRASS
jgi:ADP-ribose pyrophosphatase YjhB (NUDIX family)